MSGGERVDRSRRQDDRKDQSWPKSHALKLDTAGGEGTHPDGSCADHWPLRTAHLITPRSLSSTNLISISTSSPWSGSERSFSNACDVFSLEASSTLYA